VEVKGVVAQNFTLWRAASLGW